jgi:hypothetical protein
VLKSRTRGFDTLHVGMFVRTKYFPCYNTRTICLQTLDSGTFGLLVTLGNKRFLKTRKVSRELEAVLLFGFAIAAFPRRVSGHVGWLALGTGIC